MNTKELNALKKELERCRKYQFSQDARVAERNRKLAVWLADYLNLVTIKNVRI